MPKVSKETASQVQEFGPVTDRREEMDGYTVEFVPFAADSDLDAPLQAHVPVPSLGLRHRGAHALCLRRHEEVYEAGDAFYQPPGHRPCVEAGTELLQFSPTGELAQTERALAEWMSTQQQPAQ